MKDRYLVRVYKVKNVKEYPEPGSRDDIDEQTEDQLSTNDFQFQLQGDSLDEIAAKLCK